jgi:hypothetical protein
MTVLNPGTIVSVMGGAVTGRDRCNVPGPGHSKADRSLSIRIDPTDSLGFKVHSFAGDGWQVCRDYVAGALGLQRVGTDLVARSPDFPSQIWSESVCASGTLVEKYLASRQLGLPDRHQEVLRFHPSCPFGKGSRHPCMVGLYRDIRTNEAKAIHRTALTSDGKKIDRKSIGPIGGCAIKLTADDDVTEGLTIGEGIETVLAGMALNFQPAWALGAANPIAKFPVLSGVECLTILVDRDASGTGQASALECSRRWTKAGREVFRIVPAALGTDMADIVRERVA